MKNKQKLYIPTLYIQFDPELDIENIAEGVTVKI